MQDPQGHWHKRATKKQAQRILNTAKQQGIDTYTLAEIAEALGYDPHELGITRPIPSQHQLGAVLEAAEEAGLPPDTLARVIEQLI